MVYPSKNIWLNEGGIRKRGGTTPIDANVMYDIPDPTFNGSGLDDLTAGTVFTHTEVVVFIIQIDATGTPDTFKWMRTGGSWTTGVAITGAEQTLEYGFKITFAATTGHTLTDQWSVTITAPKVMGLHGHSLANGNKYILRATNNGKIWKNVATKLNLYKVGAVSFNGSGSDDLTADNSYSNNAARTYKIQIDGNGGIEDSKVQHEKIGAIKSTRIQVTTETTIDTTSLDVGGTGYVVDDEVTIDGGSTLATGKITGVSGGVVTTFTITNGGIGYTIANNIVTTITKGTGSGFKINILTLRTLGGHDYTVNDTFTMDDGTVLATGKVLATGDGAVTEYEILTPGSGYKVKDANNTTKTIGSGTGLHLDILSLMAEGGEDYEIDDEFTVDGGSTLATGKVLSTLAGTVVTYEITYNGVGYSVTDSVKTTTTSGDGIGFGIDIEAINDTFKWSDDNGTSWGDAKIGITGEEQDTKYDFQITFDEVTGHTVGDYWTIPIAVSSLTDDKLTGFMQDGDTAIAFNGADRPVTWDGSGENIVNFKEIPADWSGVNYPKQIVVHGYGNSTRGWALGCPETPNIIYASVNGEITNFAQSTVLTFNIPTNDGAGIVGGVDYGDRLVLFGRTQAFIITDTDADTNNWGYMGSQWSGGVAHYRLIVKTPNDIVCMMNNGEIYSVSAAEQYGDYKAASITRPSFLHEWIKKYINLSKINDFHAVYDSTLRAIKFFTVRIGKSNIDTVLCYFIDRPPDKAWVILDNQNYESGYSAKCSTLVEVSTGSLKIYTGSYNGKIWKLGETNKNDNNNAFVSIYKTPLLSFDNVREHKRYDRLKIVSIAEGACSATFTWSIDGIIKNSKDIEFSAGGDVLGSFILGTSILGGLNILESSVDLGYTGKRIQIEAKSGTANEDFFLSQFLVDFMPLQKRI